MRRELMRWDPFHDMISLQERMNKLFGDFRSRHEHPGDLEEGFWAPVADVEDTEGEIVIQAELPGMKKEDIHVEVEKNYLVISGEREHKTETKEKTRHIRERSYGKFERTVLLSAEVDSTQAVAFYENGMLTVKLPKTGQGKPKGTAIEIR